MAPWNPASGEPEAIATDMYLREAALVLGFSVYPSVLRTCTTP